MRDNYCRPISIACITPMTFPDVALYMKSGINFVLYKPHDRPFTEDDRVRLIRNQVEFLYVRTGDMEAISEFIEAGIGTLLNDKEISSFTKGQLLYQTTINYAMDIFEVPEKSLNVERCKNLLRHLMGHIGNDPNSLAALQSLISHNYYIFVHSVQVTALTLLMHATVYDLTKSELEDVGVGALLHDLGMIFISNKILDKPDPLNDVEYYKVKQHAQKGYECLRDLGDFSEITLSAVRHHHERFDGEGYPSGLKGDKISRTAQVLAICDVFSALTSDRVYKKAVSQAEALKTMSTECIGAFNPDLFSRFADMMKSSVEYYE